MKWVAIVCAHIILATVICILSACSSVTEMPKSQAYEVGTATPQPASSPRGLSSDSQIRAVDFFNFSYPYPKDLIDSSVAQNTFILRDGRLPVTRDANGFVNNMGVSVVSVEYGDATGDSREEAIIILSIQTGGSALPNCIYVYTWRDERPFLLWSSITGDRADGGLRWVWAEKGKLLLETYSPIDKKGDCCPAYFNRTRFAWRNNQFQQEGEVELLPNPEGHGSPVLPPRRP